jgi:hypothetical protein
MVNMDTSFLKIKKTTNTTFKSTIKHMVPMMKFFTLNSLMIAQNMDGGLKKTTNTTFK